MPSAGRKQRGRSERRLKITTRGNPTPPRSAATRECVRFPQEGRGMKRVRIGNGCGFWGDNLDAPVRLAASGRLDYLTLEYLAELTMSILAVQKARNPDAGFATDFIDVLGRLAPVLADQPRLKVVTNAGRMNPPGCATDAK